MMQVYRALFDLDDAGVKDAIVEIQTVARQYSLTYTNPPLPMTDPTLDEQINTTLGTDIKLDDIKRSALVNLLVNYHDLKHLKPWDDTQASETTSGSQRILVW